MIKNQIISELDFIVKTLLGSDIYEFFGRWNVIFKQNIFLNNFSYQGVFKKWYVKLNGIFVIFDCIIA